jgi:hypothetical protein
MGRFGNALLVNGEPDLSLTARTGEIVRFYLTNTANTRVFNVALPGARMKLVGGDSGRYERETFVEHVVLFDQPGRLTLEHRTPQRTYSAATITVSDERAKPSLAAEFGTLRNNSDMLVDRPNEPAFAIERFVTVLVIACPHALGLAVPLVVAISTALGAHSGLLVRDRPGLEEARSLDVVVFDKTGTLTRGEFGVVDVTATEGQTPENVLRLAAAIERESEHPIAQSIVRTADERRVVAPRTEAFEAIAGKGAMARVEGRQLFIGGPPC